MKHATERLVSLAGSLVMILAALFVFFNLVQPAYRESQELKAQKISRDNFLTNQKTTVAEVDKIIQKYQGQSTPQTLASLALPTKKDDAELINQVNVLASRYNLAVQNLNVSSPGIKNQKSGAKRPGASSLVKPVGVINLQLRVAGTYENFKSFLSNLETNLRLMDITGIALTPVGRSNQDYYAFDVGISSYYQNPD